MSNNITITGRIGGEPELRFTKSGQAVAEFSVADTWGKDDKKKTTWHDCVAFGQLAENIVSCVQKGKTVIVSGRYEQDEYTKKDGTKGKTKRLIVDECGPTLRWDKWLCDQTDNVMAQVGSVGKRIPANPFADEESPF